MKITKSKLKRIVKEEVEKDQDLLDAIALLTDSIEGLDISIDFLSAAVTGGSALSVGAGQKNLGRLYNPSPSRSHRIEVSEGTSQLKQFIREELDAFLDEVSSEKQRRWACAQKDKPASERADSLSAAEAEEMCTSKIEEDERGVRSDPTLE